MAKASAPPSPKVGPEPPCAIASVVIASPNENGYIDGAITVDWTLTPPRLVFAVDWVSPITPPPVDSASALAPFVVSALDVALAAAIGTGNPGPKLPRMPCVATAVAIAFPPPAADASAVAAALPPPPIMSPPSPPAPPVAFADDDALPEPFVLAVLLASASPPTPPTVYETPPKPPAAEVEAVALPLPEKPDANDDADPPSPLRAPPPSKPAPVPPHPPLEIASASAEPEMTVVSAVAVAAPPRPPGAPVYGKGVAEIRRQPRLHPRSRRSP